MRSISITKLPKLLESSLLCQTKSSLTSTITGVKITIYSLIINITLIING